MKKACCLSLFLFIASIHGQDSATYFALAKKAFPNYLETIKYLNKAIFSEKDFIILSKYYFTRGKVKVLTGNPVSISEAKKDLWKAYNYDKSNIYILIWDSYASLCTNGLGGISLKDINLDNIDLLSYYVSNNRHSSSFDKIHIKKLFDEYDKGNYTFHSLITCLEISNRLFEWSAYKAKIISTLLNMSEKDLSTSPEQTSPFNPHFIPNFKTHGASSFISGELPEREANIFNEKEIMKKLSKNIFLVKRIIEFEKEREAMSSPCYKAANHRYPKSFRITSFFEVLYKSGNYNQILEIVKNNSLKSTELNSLLPFYLGLIMYERGNYKNAEDYLVKSLKKVTSKDLTPAFYYLRTLINKGDYNKAFAFATRFKIQNENINNLLLCEYYFSIQDFSKYWTTRAKVKDLISNINNNIFLSHKNLSNTLGSSSYELFDYKLLNQNFNWDILIKSQINFFLSKGNYEKAKEILEYAKNCSSEYIEFKLLEAKILALNKNIDFAIKTLDEALKISPDYKNAIVLKGMLQLEKEDFKGAYQTFGILPDKKTCNYLKLISLVCTGKLDLALRTGKKLIINDCDYRCIIITHMLLESKDKATADKFLKESLNKMQKQPAKYYSKYKLGKISFEEYKTMLDFGPLFGLKFNFTIGIEAMQRGEKEKAVEHFKKCLIPYSIDLAEYHMAKACLKELEK